MIPSLVRSNRVPAISKWINLLEFNCFFSYNGVNIDHMEQQSDENI
mgnify:CR=1 FL=1